MSSSLATPEIVPVAAVSPETTVQRAAAVPRADVAPRADRPRPFAIVWFAGIHLLCFAALWTGVSWIAALVALGFYALRMFAITAGYHRHFSHRAYDTSRPFRFILGVLGAMAVQKGPLWWAATHRQHHRESDTPQDVHSPRQRGFWWSHVGWILAATHLDTDAKAVRDLARWREIRWLDRVHWVPPVLAAIGLYVLGAWLGHSHPALGTSGTQMLVWGFAISTVLLYHGSWSVNSVLHVFGRRRYATGDDSRNNLWVALYTFGEGWHNNHHRFPASAAQGFYKHEVDVSYYVLRVLEWCRVVWNVRRPSEAVLAEGRGPRAEGGRRAEVMRTR